MLWQQVLGHLRPTPTKPTGDSPISSLVSNLELIATWSLPRPMIWKNQVKGLEMMSHVAQAGLQTRSLPKALFPPKPMRRLFSSLLKFCVAKVTLVLLPTSAVEITGLRPSARHARPSKQGPSSGKPYADNRLDGPSLWLALLGQVLGAQP